MIKVAALTSYSSEPLDKKIRDLASHGQTLLDLYCFCPNDLPSLSTRTSHSAWPRRILQQLTPDKAAAKLRAMCDEAAEKANTRRIDICGLASFLPDISLPDKASTLNPNGRTVTIQVLQRLLDFMAALRRKRFACRVLELVAGHTVVRADGRLQEGRPVLKLLDENACYEALGDSLQKLVDYRSRVFPEDPPALAIELEPGACLLRDWRSLEKLLQVVKSLPLTGVNVDIGHMIILGLDRPHLFEGPVKDYVVHSHISDNARSHFADLPVGTWHPKELFLKWLRSLHDHAAGESPCYQGFLSVELESLGDVRRVAHTCAKVKRWLREIAVAQAGA